MKEIILLFVNLCTPSFIIGLHLNYFIHYWKRYVNHYMTGVISDPTCNFWQKCWGTSKIKWRLKHQIWAFSVVPCFSTIWTVWTPIKRSSKFFFHEYFMEKTKWNFFERDKHFSLNASNIWYFGCIVLKWSRRFQFHKKSIH